MKTFKSFLAENSNNAYSPFLSSDISNLKNNPEWLLNIRKYLQRSKKEMICRGMYKSSESPYILGNGHNLIRPSRNTFNFYTLLLSDYFQSWKRFPKRNKSFICTIDKLQVLGYGEPFYVIPLEGQPIGACPTRDIWNSFMISFEKYFKQSWIDLSMFNFFLKNFCLLVSGEKINLLDNQYNINDFISSLKEIDVIIRDLSEDDIKNILTNNKYMVDIDLGILVFKLIKKEKSIINLLEKIFDPNLNEFKLFKNVDEMNETVINQLSGECWMSGHVLFVQMNSFNDFKKQIEEL